MWWFRVHQADGEAEEVRQEKEGAIKYGEEGEGDGEEDKEDREERLSLMSVSEGKKW